MAAKSTWKEHLLKSGIPLEFEIKKFLDEKGCISNFEYTYLRENEVNTAKEFSYDINSTYIDGHHFIDFMIECKYRHESTKWVFMPEDYNGPDEIYYDSFLHKNHHFDKNRKFEHSFPIPFAPLCAKGIELTSDGANPKSITQAISQLAYAMAGKIVEGMHNQIDSVLSESFGGTIFYNVPVIVTTAELYRINADSSIDDIKKADEIEDISTREPFLIVKSLPGVDLEAYNKNIFNAFIKEYGEDFLDKKLNSFNKGIDFVMSVIAKHYCPTAIAVIHYSKESNGLDALFNFINRIIYPDQEVLDLLKKRKESFKLFMENFNKKPEV